MPMGHGRDSWAQLFLLLSATNLSVNACGAPSEPAQTKAASARATPAAISPVLTRVLFALDPSFSEGLAAVRIAGRETKWRYIDKTGKPVIGLVFDDAGSFSEGLAPVRIGQRGAGNYGFIDKRGQFVVKPQFALAESFNEGVAAVQVGRRDGKWGYVDKSGRLAVEPRFDWAYDFSEGLAAVRMGRRMTYIDKTGKPLGEPRFDGAEPFSDGVRVPNLVEICLTEE